MMSTINTAMVKFNGREFGPYGENSVGYALVMEIRRLHDELNRAAAPELEWEYGWKADEERRVMMTPRGPRLLIDGQPHTPEELARFPRGQRVRRRKAGPWEPLPVGGETDGD